MIQLWENRCKPKRIARFTAVPKCYTDQLKGGIAVKRVAIILLLAAVMVLALASPLN